MENKMKLKDLAVELGVDSKDMLRDLRELHITAKTSTSTLTNADVDRVKSFYQSEHGERNKVVQTSTDGIIVRRRRNTDTESSLPEEQTSPVEKSISEQVVSEQVETSTVTTNEATQASQEVAEVVLSPESETKAKKAELTEEKKKEKSVEQKPKSKPVKQQDKQPKQMARIITPPQKVEEVVSKPVAETIPVVEQIQSVVPPVAEIQVQTSEPIQSTIAVVAENVVTENEESKNKKAEQTDVNQSVEKISRSQEKSEQSEKSEQQPQQKDKSKDNKDNRDTKNRDLKNKDNKDQKRPDNRDNRNDTRRRGASASANPDGSSTASLLPPAGERRFAQRIDTDTMIQEAPKSHVRVISKPDPNMPAPEQVRQEVSRDNRDRRPDNRQDTRGTDNRGPRPDGQNRPQGPRPDGNRPTDNRGPRPDGQNRPQGQGPRPAYTPRPQDGRDKDADSKNPARPARPITPRPRPAGFEGLPFPVTEEQSRKKRNKGRRTVDFQTENSNPLDFKGAKVAFDSDDDAPRRRRRSKKREIKPVQTTAPMKAAKRKIRVDEAVRVSDMAHQMGLKASEVIKVLFGLGVMATINSSLDIDTATVVAAEFEYEVEKVGFSAEDAILATDVDTLEQLKQRPPVVTIMGHVDHGKTSLLDAIRKTNVATGEAGGITQHIGAYHVKTKRGEIVFLDTPGHEAFTAMRLRGAQITDIVVLVVAADDGVMEQTREAINHAKAANVPIIVAVNKMDKEGANPDRVIRELADLGLQAESWGGDTVTAMVSAKTRAGLDELLELIVLQSELMELKANPDKSARGHIIEAKLDKGRGPVASVLIQEGTLNQGDAFVCGSFSGRVRAIFNDQGKKIQKAGPSMPVEVQGFEGVPEAGEEFVSMVDEKMARRIADARAIKQRERELAKESRVTLETFLSRKVDAAEAQVLNLIVKADVQGSLEAITDALKKLSTEKVRINLLHGGAGSISETDIMLAAASEAIIIGFNIRPTAKVKEMADNEQVDIRFYDIIYKLVEEIRAAMAGMLAPVQKEVYLGQAEVRNTFNLPKIGAVAGTYVVDGKMMRNAGIRLLRDGVVIYTGKITSLKRFKDDAKEVAKGFECGMSLENYNDIKIGDIIDAFEIKEEAAIL